MIDQPINIAPRYMGEVQTLMQKIRARLLSDHGESQVESERPASKPEGEWQWERPVKFGLGKSGTHFLRSGWSYPEADFTWTDGGLATIELPTLDTSRDLVISVSLVPFCPTGLSAQRVRVVFDGRVCALWFVNRPGVYNALLRRQVGQSVNSRIEFNLPDCQSPSFSGVSADSRNLGVAMQELVTYIL